VSLSGCVLDASAALAFIQSEPGDDVVRDALAHGATISSVNLAEVHSRLIAQGAASERVVARLKAIGLEVESFEEVDSLAVGEMEPTTRRAGLSLADRACLALAQRLGLRVLATDRALAEADVGVDVVVIR